MGDSFGIEIPQTIILRGIFRDGEEGYDIVKGIKEYLEKLYPNLEIGDLVWDIEEDSPPQIYELKIKVPLPEEINKLGEEIKQKINNYLRHLEQVKGDNHN